MEIVTKVRYEESGSFQQPTYAAVVVDLTVEGTLCGTTVIASTSSSAVDPGERHHQRVRDLRDLFNGVITLPILLERWKMM